MKKYTCIRDIIKEVRRRGYTVEKARNGHWNVRRPNGTFVTQLPSTPSDWRTVKNTVRSLRRAGIHL